MRKSKKCTCKLILCLSIVLVLMFLFLTSTAFALENWECENNDLKAVANRIETNQMYSGSLHDSYDQDFYQFSLYESGTVEVNFIHDFVASETKLWDVILLDRDGEEIVTTSVAGDETDVMLTKIGLPAGNYYICIEDGTWWNDATYGVDVKYKKTTEWETENNDIKSLADSISVNKMYKGNIKNSYDRDFFKVSIKKQGTIKLEFMHDFVASETKLWDITLFDADGEAAITKSITGDDTELALTKLGLPAGDYYICVEDGTWWDNANYTLQAVYTKTSVWESEDNGIRSMADKISANKNYYGNIKDAYDEDFFKLTLVSKKSVKLRFKHSKVASESKLWTVTLQDEQGNEILSRDVFGDDGEIIFPKTNLKAGTYYICVEDGTWWNSAQYVINAIVPTTKAPEKVQARLSGYDDIKFSWSKVSGADGYYVYMKKASASKWTSLGTTTKCYVTKKGLAKGLKYQFKVIPYKQLSDGKYKGLEKKSKSIYTLKKISKPSVVKSSGKYVKVKWKDISGESGYQVYKMKKVNGKYKKVSSFKTTKAYKKIKVTKGKTYYYKVRAYKKVGDKTIYAPWSKVKSYKLK